MRKLLLTGVVSAVLAIGCGSNPVAPTAPGAVTVTRATAPTSTSTAPAAMKASFTFSPTTPATAQPIIFNSAGSSASVGQLVSYDWNFGDATTGSGATVTHAYAAGGTYTVTLTVTDTAGVTATSPQAVTVVATPTGAAVRYVNALAAPEVPSDMSLFFRFSSASSTSASTFSLEHVRELVSQLVGSDGIYSVEGIYNTRSGVHGLVRGQFIGTVSATGVSGQFIGTLTADVIVPPGTPCTAERRSSGPTNDALEWTAQSTASPNCNGDPLFFPSFVLLKSSQPPATTTVMPITSSTTTTSSVPGLKTLSGTVTDSAQAPQTPMAIGGATVSIQPSTQAGSTPPAVTTANDGSYSFQNLVPDTYFVTVTAQGFQQNGPSPVLVSASQAGATYNVKMASNSAPGAPTIGTATAGPLAGQATVTFSPPASNGGSSIVSYTATASGGIITASCSTGVAPVLFPLCPAPLSITVSNLNPGVPYTFTVFATNLQSGGSVSAQSNSVTPPSPAGKPLTPAAPTAVAGNGQATVTFFAPGDGGSPITGFTVRPISAPPGGAGSAVTCNIGGANPCPPGPVYSLTIPGLTNGTAYTFTVEAFNIIGTGPASPASSPAVVPGSVPGAPTGVSAAAVAGQAIVTFTAPASNGGPITSYTATSNPGGFIATCNVVGPAPVCPVAPLALSLTVTGLQNGVAYTFTVTAANNVGTGPASVPSNSLTLPVAAVPGAPTGVSAIAGNGQATVSFNTPPSNGSPITSYTVTPNPNPLGALTVIAASSPVTVTGLSNGTSYTFTVIATNGAGPGPASNLSNAVTPTAVAVPDKPTGVTAVAGNAQAIVSFNAPASNGSPITSYTVTPNPNPLGALTVIAASSPITVTGLANGTSYTFTVTATNGVGPGPASNASNSVTPTNVTKPDPPTGVTAVAGNAQAVVSFNAPSSNGSPITSYTVTGLVNNNAVVSASGGGSPITVTGLTNGTTYTFTVTAINAVAPGNPSTPSIGVTPAASAPGAPVNPQAQAFVPNVPGQIRVTFAAPASDGGSAILRYDVACTSTDGGTSRFGSVSGNPAPAGPVTVTQLDTTKTYSCAVTAVNAVGPGNSSTTPSIVAP